MKKLLLLVVILNLFQHITVSAQNLVPNSGFEIIDTCNSAGGIWLGVAPPWDSPTDGGSDDVFNICGSFSNCSAPVNGFGFQQPHSDSGYAGGVFYGGLREYCQVQLDSSLLAGKKYCISFYVSLSNISSCGINKIGMYFSNTHTYISTSGPIGVIPQINYDTIITDTTNWTLISRQYTAVGGERYIIIGNFYSDASTDTTHIGLSPWGSYFYIDDVTVINCDNTGVAEIKNDGQITLYPNPTSSTFTISSTDKIESVKIYNIIGELYFTETPNNTQSTININQLPKGIYFVEIKTEKEIVRKKVVKE